MPRLSILIPFLGNRDSLETTLASVLQNRPAGTEIIVALGREYDDPYDIDEEVRFLCVEGRRNPIEIVNEGFRACLAPIVHVLACGATVSEGWTDAAIAHFSDRRVASVAPVIADVDHPDRILAAGLEYLPGGVWRRRGRGLRVDGAGAHCSSSIGPSLEAGFYRRRLADGAQGPFDPTLEQNAAEVDLGLRLKQAGHSTVVEAESLVCLAAPAPRRGGTFSAARRRRAFVLASCRVARLAEVMRCSRPSGRPERFSSPCRGPLSSRNWSDVCWPLASGATIDASSWL